MEQLRMLMTAQEVRDYITEDFVGDFSLPGERVVIAHKPDGTKVLLAGDLSGKGYLPVEHREYTDTFAGTRLIHTPPALGYDRQALTV